MQPGFRWLIWIRDSERYWSYWRFLVHFYWIKVERKNNGYSVCVREMEFCKTHAFDTEQHPLWSWWEKQSLPSFWPMLRGVLIQKIENKTGTLQIWILFQALTLSSCMTLDDSHHMPSIPLWTFCLLFALR